MLQEEVKKTMTCKFGEEKCEPGYNEGLQNHEVGR